MAGERRINFGADATDARYRIEDTGDGANLVLAEDLDGATVLLEYDDSRTPSEWVVRGPVDLDGNDLSAGAIDANAVNTGLLSGNVVGRVEAIDNLEGNVYLEPDGTDPGTVLENDGDMVFIHE